MAFKRKSEFISRVATVDDGAADVDLDMSLTLQPEQLETLASTLRGTTANNADWRRNCSWLHERPRIIAQVEVIQSSATLFHFKPRSPLFA